MKLCTINLAMIHFPDSGWRLEITKDSEQDEVAISLYWNNKPFPTHQAICPTGVFTATMRSLLDE